MDMLLYLVFVSLIIAIMGFIVLRFRGGLPEKLVWIDRIKEYEIQRGKKYFIEDVTLCNVLERKPGFLEPEKPLNGYFVVRFGKIVHDADNRGACRQTISCATDRISFVHTESLEKAYIVFNENSCVVYLKKDAFYQTGKVKYAYDGYPELRLTTEWLSA